MNVMKVICALSQSKYGLMNVMRVICVLSQSKYGLMNVMGVICVLSRSKCGLMNVMRAICALSHHENKWLSVAWRPSLVYNASPCSRVSYYVFLMAI